MKPLESREEANPGAPLANAAAAALFSEAVAIMARLRGTDGCPWDREQTLATIRKYTVEEVYEVIDAIDREHWDDLREELGDLLLQVLFHAEIARNEQKFTIFDVLSTLNRKLIRRHPHVFGDAAAAAAGNQAQPGELPAASAAAVLRNWDAIKRAEKQGHAAASLLDTVPRSFPSLLEASKLGSKAAGAGFDWPDSAGVLEKLHEEMAELLAEIQTLAADPQLGTQKIEEELGDLLFTAANLARHLKVDAELALRGANAKFRRRFAAMESGSAAPLGSLDASQREELWADAKSAEGSGRASPR